MDLGILMIIVLIFSAIFHEYAHGLAAYMHGDPTAKNMGRLTFNPIPHIDPFLTILLPAMMIFSGIGFVVGGAKPVPVNPHNLRGKYADLKVAMAGPFSNILLAVFFGLAIRFVPAISSNETLLIGFSVVVFINLLLAIFNLMPIPPLDGSYILFTLFPGISRSTREFLARYGIFIFFGAIIIFSKQIFTTIGFLITIFFYFITGAPPVL